MPDTSSRWTNEGPSPWHPWRRAAVVLAALAFAVAIGALWLRRDQRRLVVLPNGVLLLAVDTKAHFLRDSAFAITLGEGDGSAYPIRVAARHDPKSAAVSELAIVRAVESIAAGRKGARLTRVAGGVLEAGAAPERAVPWVSIEMDFGRYGDARTDVIAHCRVPLRDGSATVTQATVSSNRGLIIDAPGLALVLRQALDDAMRARCPGDPTAPTRGATPQRTPGASIAAAPASTVTAATAPAATPAAAPDESPPAAPARLADRGAPHPVTDAELARRDSLAFVRASAQNQRIVRLVAAADTVFLRIGDVVKPDKALRLTPLDARGVVVSRFVPLYTIADMSIAAMGGGGVRGVKAGVTRATVSPLVLPPVDATPAAVSASFVIKVTP